MKYDFILQKQGAIQDVVDTAIGEEGRQLGLSQLMNSSPLGKAALSMGQAIVAMEDPYPDQIKAEYRQRAKLAGYRGGERSSHHNSLTDEPEPQATRPKKRRSRWWPF